MKRLALILALVPAAVSCKFNFEVTNDSAPAVFVNFVSSPDRAVIGLSYASPLGVDVVDFPDVEPTSVKVSVNGRQVVTDELEFEWKDVNGGHSLQPGDDVSVHIDSKGLPSVSAATVMPSAHSLSEFVLTPSVADGVRVNVFDLKLDSQPSDNEWTGISIMRVTRTGSPDDSGEGDGFAFYSPVLPVTGASLSSEIEVAQTHFSNSDMRVYQSNSHPFGSSDDLILTLFPARAFKEGALSLFEMELTYAGGEPDLNISEDEVIPDEEYEADSNVFYEVAVMGVSEDFYRYCLAQHKSRSDFLARMGLAPAQFAWSNVNGGFGLCGAINPISCSWAESAVLTESRPH